MKTTIIAIGALAAILVGAGCSGEKSGSGSQENQAAFANAEPGVKTAWDTAIAARQTNGYAVAVLTLKQLQANPGLTPEQQTAINDTIVSINTELNAAAEKGDANANQQLELIRKNWR